MEMWNLHCEARVEDTDPQNHDVVSVKGEHHMVGLPMQEVQHEALSFVSRWEKKGAVEIWVHIVASGEEDDA